MNYLKFTQFAYLIAGIIFAIDAFRKFQENDQNYVISVVFAVIGIFMFFFRRKFAKKYSQQNNNNSNSNSTN